MKLEEFFVDFSLRLYELHEEVHAIDLNLVGTPQHANHIFHAF